MNFINISGVPMAGKSTTGKMLVKKLNELGQKAVFIEVDDLILDSEKHGKNLQEKEEIKRNRLLEQLKQHKKDKDCSVVVFACLMDTKLSDTCKKLCGKENDFISISLVPKLEALISKRGERAPTPEIIKLITKMYNEWGFSKPKTADLIIDNTRITLEQSVEQIMDFIQTGKKKSFEKASNNVKNKNMMQRIWNSLFQKE